MSELIIALSLVWGFVGWIIHLFFILVSYTSKNKWSLEINYNTLKEGYLEIVVISTLIILSLISFIMYLNW